MNKKILLNTYVGDQVRNSAEVEYGKAEIVSCKECDRLRAELQEKEQAIASYRDRWERNKIVIAELRDELERLKEMPAEKDRQA